MKNMIFKLFTLLLLGVFGVSTNAVSAQTMEDSYAEYMVQDSIQTIEIGDTVISNGIRFEVTALPPCTLTNGSKTLQIRTEPFTIQTAGLKSTGFWSPTENQTHSQKFFGYELILTQGSATRWLGTTEFGNGDGTITLPLSAKISNVKIIKK